MQELRSVIQSHYSSGVGLVYIREIFEPIDADFSYSLSCGRVVTATATPAILSGGTTFAKTSAARGELLFLAYFSISTPKRP